ncbi:DNA-binding response regulator [Dictyobacter alpinus]|uniref:DNA-binding response regulator n=1 Tax=Dictyobacter alpinus TaxID=2014873 RepID=A0A402B8I8_9CHLR|nr:response regulator transcription factor [Dictyobacter alpinus]GCE27622.1 DNA-binding response regulator [Dictyobacter alpinus]
MNTMLPVKDTALNYHNNDSTNQLTYSALIVEKFLLLQRPLRKTLEELPYIQSVLAAHTLTEVGEIVHHTQPEIVVLSTSVSFKETLMIIELLKQYGRRTNIIIITDNVTPEASRLLIKSGIQGILDTSSTEQDLKNAIEASVTGNIFHARAIYNSLTVSSNNIGSLTARETQVLALILEGADNYSIAKHLYVTIKTVEAHVTRIYSKLHVTSRAQAILRTQELCLL